MEAIPRFSNRLLSLSSINPNTKSLITPFLRLQLSQIPTFNQLPISPNPLKTTRFFLSTKTLNPSSPPSTSITRAGWLLGLGNNKRQKQLPDLVKAGDPVLHEAAREVDPKDIGSEKIQKIIDDMIGVMRMAPGVGLAAPQIGIPLKVASFTWNFFILFGLFGCDVYVGLLNIFGLFVVLGFGNGKG